jgi:ABC-type multidrug transport system ATPase subunit
MPTETLALRDVHKSFGNTEAVAGISLRVDAGETLALLGQTEPARQPPSA